MLRNYWPFLNFKCALEKQRYPDVQTLKDWKGVPDWLAGVCFNTTSSSTGVHTSAITVIQQAYDKRLLFLLCRHHVFEFISAAVFDLFFKSSGPQIAIFSRFKEQWKFINTTKFRTIDAPAIGVKSEKRKDIIGFLQNELSQDNQPHQD